MRRSIITPFFEHKQAAGIAATSIVCIYLSLYSGVFGLAAFMLNLIALVMFKPEEYIIVLVSLVPWAYVFKINGVSTSLFAILVLAASFWYMLRIRSVDKRYFAYLCLFILNTVSQFRINNSTMMLMYIKLLFNLILLYEMCKFHKAKNMSVIMLIFVISVLLSSCVAYFIPNKAVLHSRIRETNLLVEFKYARFTGLQNDPNYYNASLVISLLALCYLYIKKEIGTSFFPLSLACICFGLLTYSKSFFLLLLMWFAIVVYYAVKKKRYFLGGVFLGISVLAIVYIFSGNVQLIGVLMNRFNDPAGITSGRTDTWGMFLHYFSDELGVLLFGNGFESLILQGYASHNTYIDVIYYFGIMGTILLFAIIFRCFKQNTLMLRQTFPYIFMMFILVIYCFLSGITLCELPFYLYFIFVFFNRDERTASY